MFGINPYSHGQAITHAHRAAEFAEMIVAFNLDYSFTSTTDRWGLLLLLFWLLPGPSGLYAQIGIALLGTIAIFNVYLICEHFYSQQAGLLASIPLSIFPTYVFMHSVVQREAMIFFAITSAYVLVFLPNRHISKPYNYVFTSLLLFIVGYLRLPNFPILAMITITLLAVWGLRSDHVSTPTGIAGIGSIFILGSIFIISLINRLIVNINDLPNYIGELRKRRARGRAVYLPEMFPSSWLEIIIFSWIGAIYFLFAPFPWHIEEISDIIGVIESTIGIGFAIFAFYGVKTMKYRSNWAALTLVVGILFFSVSYGLGTANYGTATRHRQVIVWAVFVLGAIGFSSKVGLETNDH